jgi:beta-glucosidase
MFTSCYKLSKLALLLLLFAGYASKAQQPVLPFRQASLSQQARVSDLLSRLTPEEKISLLGFRSQAVDRLGIPAYNWWNEALHGVARAGKATVFPQAIAMAASFNDELMLQVADVISTEARAKYNLAVQQDRRLQYMGLSFWSPNINIFRDPRWGRGQETYGEDPFLTATMGTAFVRGMQGNDKDHLKTAACAKHFAVHSGPEASRHSFNALVDEKDLRETYLYAFKRLVDAGVVSVMCAYNRVNGEPCCTGNTLLQQILRKEWGFKGQTVTDCWALEDIWSRHKSLPNSVEVAAAAIRAGVNMDCSNLLQDDVMKALQQNLLTQREIDSALAVTLALQMKLGFFDDPAASPYAGYGADSVSNAYHIDLAKKMAEQSMVLLKNDNHVLPLDNKKYSSIMVVGPTAASLDALLGNYHGLSGKAVNFVEGITAAAEAGIRVEYDQGCDFTDTTHFGGTWAAGNADITIAVIGLTPVYEGEEGDAFLAPGGGDKKNISMPASEIAYMKALRKAHNKPIIAVITAGSAVDVSAIAPYADAIIYTWYPGEQGGAALADLLFGKISPSGHLPVTFYASINDLPAYDNYDMQGRTYRYYNGKVLYPFGYGLSYTSFDYAWEKSLKAKYTSGDSIVVSLSIKNTGALDGDELVQVYVEYPKVDHMPLKELKAFKKISIGKGANKEISLSIPLAELQKWDAASHKWKLYNGTYTVAIGKSSEDYYLKKNFRVADH